MVVDPAHGAIDRGETLADLVLEGQVEALQDLGILCKETKEHTIRLAPPLVISDEEIDWALTRIEEALRADKNHEIKGVMVVHNETATGVTSDIVAVRRAIDAAKHPALLYVDGVSSIGSVDFRFDEWGVDLAITGSQKGMMLPAGLGIVCASPKALERMDGAACTKAYFDFADHFRILFGIRGDARDDFFHTRKDPCMAAPQKQRVSGNAKSMAAKQREISISEFFTKNRHLLGFDSPAKALLTTIKEAVDNSLDACEEAGIVPEIWVHIESVGNNRYIRENHVHRRPIMCPEISRCKGECRQVDSIRRSSQPLDQRLFLPVRKNIEHYTPGEIG